MSRALSATVMGSLRAGAAATTSFGTDADGTEPGGTSKRPQHALYRFPLPQGHGSFLPRLIFTHLPRLISLSTICARRRPQLLRSYNQHRSALDAACYWTSKARYLITQKRVSYNQQGVARREARATANDSPAAK